jgi:hypothetical protein
MNLAVFYFSNGWSSASVHIVGIACSWTAGVAIPVSCCIMYITLFMDSRSGYTSILLYYVYHTHPLKCLDMSYWLYNVSSVPCLVIQWNCHIIFLNLSISSLDVYFPSSQSCYLNVTFIAFNVSLTLVFKSIILSKSTHPFRVINETSDISII